jgi:hypothetical protein
MGASRSTTITRSDLDPAREYPVNLGSHDEIVLMQSLDLLGLQRDRGIPPTKADIRMMAFRLREFTNLLDKTKRLPEVANVTGRLGCTTLMLLSWTWMTGRSLTSFIPFALNLIGP